MKKNLYFGIITLFLLWLIIGVVDFNRVINFEKPMFCIGAETADDGVSGHYIGIGYSFNIEGVFVPDTENTIKCREDSLTKCSGYIFGIRVFSKEKEEISLDNEFGYSIKVAENRVAVLGKGTLSQAVELSTEDKNFLLKAVENIEWVEDNPMCEQDCAITLKGNLYYYHSSCGTLEKIDLSEVSAQSSKEPKHSDMFILDNETKDLVNTVLEKYIELEK